MAKAKKKNYPRESWLQKTFMPKKGYDPWILGAMLTLLVFGSIMVVSTQMADAIGYTTRLYVAIIKQLFFSILGWEFGIVFLSRFFNYKRMRALQFPIESFYFLLLVATALIGSDVNGSRAWIQIGSAITIQPSEFGKPLLIALLATSFAFFSQMPKEDQTFLKTFRIPIFQMISSVVFIGGLQKDFGSLIITLGIGIVGMLLIPYPPLQKTQRRIFIVVVIAVILVIIGVYTSEAFVDFFSNIPLVRHIAVRIQNMRNPYSSIHDIGYQPANALYAIADAGIFGKGLGNSVRKYGFLSQSESDYILSIVIEETGILGFGLIVICYSILTWRFVYWALKANRTADKVLLMCSASYFMLHFFINVGGVGMLIPMTGVPLLLISSGGSALLSTCFCIGLTQARISEIRTQSTT